MAGERRKFKRIPFGRKVEIHQVVESRSGNVYEVRGAPLAAVACNLSEGGLCVKWIGAARSQDLVKVQFEFEEGKTLDGFGRIVWNRGARSGLQFLVLNAAGRRLLRSFVHRFGNESPPPLA